MAKTTNDPVELAERLWRYNMDHAHDLAVGTMAALMLAGTALGVANEFLEGRPDANTPEHRRMNEWRRDLEKRIKTMIRECEWCEAQIRAEADKPVSH